MSDPQVVRLIAKRMIARKILERGMNLSRKVMNVQERRIAYLRLWSCEGEALYAALRRHAGEFQYAMSERHLPPSLGRS